jgi:Tol biopolymer transport system component
VLFGGPGLEARAADLKGHAAEPRFAIDDGRLVAIATPAPGFSGPLGEPAIWILDLATGNASRSHTLPPRSTLQIAGWSPDEQWILYWDTPEGSTPAEPRPLMAVQRRSSLGPVRVGETRLYGDDLTWCGQMLILEAGDDRLVPKGRRLVAARPPNWTIELLTNLANDIWSRPSCSPDGDAVAAMTFPVYPKRKDTSAITALGIGGGHSARWQLQGGEYRNPSEWSSDGHWLMVEQVNQDRRGVSLGLLNYGEASTLGGPRIHIIELGEEAEVLGPRAYDWYLP